nr:G protein-coupled receptor [Proales similis]
MSNLTEQRQQQTAAPSVSLDVPTEIVWLGSFLYTFIFAFGTIGNFLVIYVLIKQKELRNFTNYLLANLAISDLFVLFTCVPVGMHDLFAKERWYLGEVACYLVGFVENCMSVASILSLLMITVERFMVICLPLHVKSVMTFSRTVKILIAIWVVSIVLNVPFIFRSEYKLAHFFDNDIDEYKCTAKPSNQWSYIYFLSITFAIYCLIGFMLLLLFALILRSLNASNRLLRENKRAQISSSCPQQADDDKHIKTRRQLIIMLICINVLFYICLFPLKIWNLILLLFAHKPKFIQIISLRSYMLINVITRSFFYLNSAINPVLYNCLSKKFRDGFRSLYFFRLICGRSTQQSSSSP